MAQVPSIHSEYGKECRRCWTVPEGYKLVGIDASQLELRLLAHYMASEEYINEIINGTFTQLTKELLDLNQEMRQKLSSMHSYTEPEMKNWKHHWRKQVGR